MNELDAYDNIGIQYYYLHNVSKAMYYHNRMMNGKLEPNNIVKKVNISNLMIKRNEESYKKYILQKTIFDKYANENSDFIYPHKDESEFFTLKKKFLKFKNKNFPISPKCEIINLEEEIMKKAAKEVSEKNIKHNSQLCRLNRRYTKKEEGKNMSDDTEEKSELPDNYNVMSAARK